MMKMPTKWMKRIKKPLVWLSLKDTRILKSLSWKKKQMRNMRRMKKMKKYSLDMDPVD